MQTLRTVLLVVFFVDSALLVIAVLLQSGRGGGLAGALGGMGSPESAFGIRAASQIEKATAVLAAIFLAVALALAFLPSVAAEGPEVEMGERAGSVEATTPPAWATPEPGTAPTSPPKGAAPPEE